MHREGLQLQQSCAMQRGWRGIGKFFSFIVFFPVCVPLHHSEGFCHLPEHFLVGNFSPLQILPIHCARPHRFLPVLVWLMGERRAASTSERNARNRNNFINKTTKLFFNICSHLQGENKQTNRKTHWGVVVGVREQRELAQVVWAGLGRVPFLHPSSTVGCPQPTPAPMSRARWCRARH